jgi:hypothetical protein
VLTHPLAEGVPLSLLAIVLIVHRQRGRAMPRQNRRRPQRSTPSPAALPMPTVAKIVRAKEGARDRHDGVASSTRHDDPDDQSDDECGEEDKPRDAKLSETPARLTRPIEARQRRTLDLTPHRIQRPTYRRSIPLQLP